MKILLSVLFLALSFSVAQAQGTTFEEGVGEISGAVDSVTGAVGSVGNLVNSVTGGLNGSASGGSGTGTGTGTATSSGAGMFNPDVVFPSWEDGGRVTGVIGANGGALNQGDSRLIIYFIPKVIELMIWLVAPIITFMFIYAGLQFVFGGDREEEVKKSRDMFRYAVIGLIFIVLSYSLMKAVFFILV